MGPAPARLLIESLFVTFYAVPANKVRPVVRAEGFDDVRGFAVATFAAVHYEVFDAHEFFLTSSYYVLLPGERQLSRKILRLRFQNSTI